MSDTNSGEFLRLQSALAGRYFLEREVGRGGMGVVYLARDVALDRPVALKLLPARMAQVPALRQRFLSEARTAAKLSHPNIVPIYAVEEAGEFVFFVMAFIDGETLGQRVRERGPIPPTELTTILREVSWGLGYAHGQGVVHRDVKSDNILLETGSNRALIADFGIARVAERSGGTQPTEIIGTAEYMSPEQASGENVDLRSDIYSLGIVAFYALSGKLPFEGPSVATVLAKQITQPAPPINEAAEGVPSRLARAVDRCLAKDPGSRFQQATDMADALALALEARREAPMAIKLFIRKVRELMSGVGLNLIAQTIFLSTSAFVFIFAPTGDKWIGWMILGWDALLFSLPFWGFLRQVRTLLRGGYTRDDVLAAWRTDLERESEERLFEVGRRADPLERAMRLMSMILVPVGIVAFLVLLFGQKFLLLLPGAAIPMAWLGFVSGLVGAGSGIIASFQHVRRTDLAGRLLGRLLNTNFARACFDAMTIGLRKVRLVAPPTHRPTEMAIGMAVESLFAALDKPTQKQLADLPETVQSLEEDASRMRRRVEELDDAVAKIDAARETDPRRAAMDDSIRAARDDARTRLADAVSALEGIRLDLLRLTAGTGSVAGLTTDLVNAKDVSEEVRRLIEGQAEVETYLKKK